MKDNLTYEVAAIDSSQLGRDDDSADESEKSRGTVKTNGDDGHVEAGDEVIPHPYVRRWVTRALLRGSSARFRLLQDSGSFTRYDSRSSPMQGSMSQILCHSSQ